MSGPADTYMPLFIGDYLGDTMHLSTLEHGAYLLLIFHYWRTGKPLPDGDEALARITRLSRSQWDEMADVIRAFFRPETIDGESVLTHTRVASELERAKAEYEKRKSGADKTNTRRWGKDRGGTLKPSQSVSPPYPSPYGEGDGESAPLKGGGVSHVKEWKEKQKAIEKAIGTDATIWLNGASVVEDDDGTIVVAVPLKVQADRLKAVYWPQLEKTFGAGKYRVDHVPRGTP